MTQMYVDTPRQDKDVKFLASIVKFLNKSSILSSLINACRLGLVPYEQMLRDVANYEPSYDLVTTDIGETIELANRLLGEKFFTEPMLAKFLRLSDQEVHDFLTLHPDYQSRLAS